MIRCSDEETIIAQCTPQGQGAIALLRICGLDAIAITSKISALSTSKSLDALPSHTIHHGWIIDRNHKKIDQVLFLLMHGPRTFTGQHTVEITCHNNPFIIQDIIECAIAAGARLAQQGEFTKRAVLNNKIDLIQAEAINEVIHANTQQALKSSLEQLEGSFSSWIHTLEQHLVKALAFSEASFEFIDEAMEFGDTIRDIIKNILHTIESLKITFNQQQHIRNGIRIALIGSVNAGKSSLFNALLNQSRAIVTPIAGTTRDVIECGTYRYGTYITLVDTAGLRQTDDVIEQEGIKRSYEQAELADIVILVCDGSRSLSALETEAYRSIASQHASKIIHVINKSDQPIHPTSNLTTQINALSVSAISKHNLALLEHYIEEKISTLFTQNQSPFLLNRRQYTLLLDVEKKLQVICDMLESSIEYELLSYHIQETLTQLSELTGKTISEQGMDAVFRQFCIGK